MTSRDFCYWLQGYFEISEMCNVALGSEKALPLHKCQVEIIKKHLSLVFKHEIDPSMGDQKHQDDLNMIHQINPKNVVVRC